MIYWFGFVEELAETGERGILLLSRFPDDEQITHLKDVHEKEKEFIVFRGNKQREGDEQSFAGRDFDENDRFYNFVDPMFDSDEELDMSAAFKEAVKFCDVSEVSNEAVSLGGVSGMSKGSIRLLEVAEIPEETIKYCNVSESPGETVKLCTFYEDTSEACKETSETEDSRIPEETVKCKDIS